MKAYLRVEEYSRPKLFWIEFENGKESDCFFMGDIKSEVKRVEKIGFVIQNKAEFKSYF